MPSRAVGLAAGGPGSGRRPGGGKATAPTSWGVKQPDPDQAKWDALDKRTSGMVKGTLQQHGWKEQGAGTFSHSDHPGHDISVSKNGSWEHRGPEYQPKGPGYDRDAYKSIKDTYYGHGGGSTALQQHLNRFEEERSEGGSGAPR